MNKEIKKARYVKAEHYVINNMPDKHHGYFAWPSVARMPNGTIIAISSGFRAWHICPWGKTIINVSKDDGRTWSEARVVNDSPIDDRDAGIISLGGSKLLLSWFSSDTRWYAETLQKRFPGDELDSFMTKLEDWTDEMVSENIGSWIKISEDGENWGPGIRVPVTAPHGPIALADGEILYLGKQYDGTRSSLSNGKIMAAKSSDGGKSWNLAGEVPLPENTVPGNFHEPHAVELPNGRIIGLIRYQYSGESRNYEPFSMFQTESDDGGFTWSLAKPIGVYGAPPHILRHSSGALICTYSYRKEPFGQRIMISYDEGRTWMDDFILRDDGVDWDLGYPASVELGDGSILTVYYQKMAKGVKCSILCSKWELTEKGGSL